MTKLFPPRLHSFGVRAIFKTQIEQICRNEVAPGGCGHDFKGYFNGIKLKR